MTLSKLEKHREYNRTHKDKLKEYRDNHKDEFKQYYIKYHEENKYRLKEYQKQYKIKNKERKKELDKSYRLKNLVSIRLRQKEWELNNPDKIFARRQRELKKLSYKTGLNMNEILSGLLSFASMIKHKQNICQVCNKTLDLEAHHIIHKKYYPKLMFNENNGITLCHFCHQQAHGRKLLLNPFVYH